MRTYQLILPAVFLFLTSTLQSQEVPPAAGFRVIDVVDLPGKLSNAGDDDWYLQFRENWFIDPKKTTISKQVEKYHPLNHALPDVSPDSLRSIFASLIREQPAPEGRVVYREISYEFVLLEPHLEGSGNTTFPSPDSLDEQTLALQQSLVSLVSRRSRMGSLLDLEQQLLSVQFHEDWYIDPATMEITKHVEAITPVIWQRRRTDEGEPINDPETGFPVYYKNMLERIRLRNP